MPNEIVLVVPTAPPDTGKHARVNGVWKISSIAAAAGVSTCKVYKAINAGELLLAAVEGKTHRVYREDALKFIEECREERRKKLANRLRRR
jgi:hypothetical protein